MVQGPFMLCVFFSDEIEKFPKNKNNETINVKSEGPDLNMSQNSVTIVSGRWRHFSRGSGTIFNDLVCDQANRPDIRCHYVKNHN